MIMTLLCAGIGGFIGSTLRVACGIMIAKTGLLAGFPLATLIVNAVGSFVIGIFLNLPALNSSPALKTLLTAGLLGGLTTFSTFSYDCVALFANRQFLLSGLNIMLNLGIAFALCFAGTSLASRFFN